MKYIKIIGSIIITVLSFIFFDVALRENGQAANTTKIEGFLDNGIIFSGLEEQRTPNINDPLEQSLLSKIKLRGVSSITNSTVVSPGSFRMSGQGHWNDTDNRNEVNLTWVPPTNISGGYHVERDTSSSFNGPQEIGTNYGKRFRVLNVAPKNAASGRWFERWMKMQNSDNTGPVDKGLFDITTVWLRDFNANPGMLKNPDGSYKYDSIFFGASDWNSNNYNSKDQDLTEASYQATKAFGDTGRSITFGHDAIEGAGWQGMAIPYHTQFNKFAPLLGLSLDVIYRCVGSERLKIATPGSLTEQPYFLNPNLVYTVSLSHSFNSYYVYDSGAIRWIKYDENSLTWSYGDPYVTYIRDGSGRIIADNNWYLVSKKNYAQIQTGHTSGRCTPQEAEVIFNMIYYTSSLNTSNNGKDITSKDLDAPNKPNLLSSSVVGDNASLKIDAQDNATNYYYRARADASSGNAYSDIIKVPVTSGIKGYVYILDSNPIGAPTITRDPATNKVTNINLLPDSDGTSGTINLTRVADAGKYLHIVAVDNNSNVSAVETINLSNYL